MRDVARGDPVGEASQTPARKLRSAISHERVNIRSRSLPPLACSLRVLLAIRLENRPLSDLQSPYPSGVPDVG